MSEKPILFSGAMVRAILDGAKTQTRRLVKLDGFGPTSDPNPRLDFCFYRGDRDIHVSTQTLIKNEAPVQPGDTLWVREAWWADRLFDDRPPRDVPEWSPTLMLADETHRGGHLGHPGRYRHARYMPRHFSRIDLRVRTVRVERLGDISEADARAEGLRLHAAGWTDGVNGYDTLSARDAFAELWEHVHGDGAWERDRSRWVWVYGFEVVR
jgi:hypothetical protein